MNKHINKKRLTVEQRETREGLLTSVDATEPVQYGALVKRPDPNTKLVETDGMPAEVATGLLCETSQSNRMRKVCRDARAKHFVSTRKPKPMMDRTMQRLSVASWAQILKWHKRAVNRELATQHVLRSLNRALEKIGEPDIKKDPKGYLRRALIIRSIKAYDLKGTALQQGIECLESEIDRRKSFVEKLAEVAPSVAKAMDDEMTKTAGQNS